MYDLMLPKNIEEEKIKSSIAKILSVKVEDIDLSDVDNFADRNWDALVFCEYSVLQGDLVLGLSAYAAEETGPTLSERDFSRKLSQELGIFVVFPGDKPLPSVWRAAIPEGKVLYIRLEEPEEEGGDFRITGSESPLHGFPHVPLDDFPDVIRIEQISTPLVDLLYPEKPTGELGEFYNLAVNWERLTTRMAMGCPPFGWYPNSLYHEDLEMREKAERIANTLPEEESKKAQSLLAQVDQKFREETVEIDQQNHNLEIVKDSPWYWYRTPRSTP